MDTLSKDVQDFNNLHPNRKLAVFGLVLFVFVISILVGIYFSQMKSGGSMSKSESGVDASKTTTLTMVPSTSTIKVGDTFKVSVMLDGEAVPGSDVVITYDPAFFAVADKDIVVGSAFNSLPFKEVKNGKISATAIIDLNAPEKVKTGEVLSVTFEALKAGTSPLGFDTEDTQDVQKTITSRVGGQDTLKSAQGITVVVQ